MHILDGNAKLARNGIKSEKIVATSEGATLPARELRQIEQGVKAVVNKTRSTKERISLDTIKVTKEAELRKNH